MRYLIGIGTYMGLDDSIGLRIAEAIAERGLERGFRAVELQGNLLDLLHYLDPGTDSVLVVDSARMGLAPGEYRFFSPEDVISRKRLDGISTHEGDLLKVLDFAREINVTPPPITLLGIEPAGVVPEMGLSAELEQRFPEYLEAATGFFANAV
ncbi:hydrogenase maturation protease [Anaerosoma tenue]|uniref:hydrogenase maturation protease n=1 Tax=Anaerosoma tenue TaxID=2933588 RepID=UPI00226082FB|nr:hydrogenase maturation protease [Anaerosoma tenue]MCK8114994.1 hydrogenase maturation protease [Anaerosoma tenue]